MPYIIASITESLHQRFNAKVPRGQKAKIVRSWIESYVDSEDEQKTDIEKDTQAAARIKQAQAEIDVLQAEIKAREAIRKAERDEQLERLDEAETEHMKDIARDAL